MLRGRNVLRPYLVNDFDIVSRIKDIRRLVAKGTDR